MSKTINDYDNLVDELKVIINSKLMEAFGEGMSITTNQDTLQAFSDAEEEVFVDYLEANGFEIFHDGSN